MIYVREKPRRRMKTLSFCEDLLLSLLPLLVVTAVWLDAAAASEFPERECCDSIPPLPAQYTTPPASGVTEQPKTSTSTTVRPTAVSVRTSPPIVDCKVARQLCRRSAACQYITSIIPRLCGPELVSCSTVTVTKCRAALRTLVAFQFFQPTCLCKEQRIDPECNTYRNLVFDHPCLSVRHLDKDPFPTQALPTCEYALNACHQQPSCSRVYHDYRRLCPFSDGTCHMKNSSACSDAWIALKKRSPLYGCICTDFRDWNCERAFKAVHENPCIVSGLGGAEVSRPLADQQLVAPLFNLTSERPWSSSIERTLYGPEMDSMNNKSEESAVKEKQKTTAKLPSANPAGSVDVESAGPVLQSSCHTALANCRRDRRCRLLLEPMLNSCVADSCHRQQCMKHMQEFYDQSDSVLVMDAALCVCRRSDAGESGCVAAMQRLHPACASQPEGGRLPSCLRVARHCRRQWDGRCRPRLERYEQACAVDVVTARCAGPSEHCRSALLAVLGTELHSHCGCHDAPAAGSTPGQHSCHDWERLLWANPCVELSQREYLLRQPSGSPLHGPPAPVQPPSSSRRRQAALPDSQRLVTDSAAGDATIVPSHPHCVVRKPGRPDDFILVGAGVRYYRLKGSSDPYREEKDCSELCMCHGRGRLVCNVLDCLEKRECQSSLALYYHGTAGLVSYQEGCVCHHGDFICARPADDDYSLPFGVFLFLGYSRAEQDMLYPHTHKTIRQYVVEELKNILDVVLKRQDLGAQVKLIIFV
ncbi:uncharacterized protein LOC122385988 [Amphibalanus amphitrite]|uniref:uncharacterized protein LOC122385988 n=1 Tax=Amphibalanus amphitrite TaxID=1232801 RepID=UPI001C908663|nr:uncharacterized protein LOC122385988 [Amphibalanus amphitrite]